MPNRLANETSPYLLQHQYNPVDWYPWGPEAFEAARVQNKPIFLSVGYSTCYWCHVMERQCFEVEAIAEVMNRLFINIKVDREERPDVDQLYMTAVQLLTRQGGWPMSVFLLPDRRPFYGGTYFPPTDGHGRPGFPRLMEALSEAYRERHSDVERTATELTDAIRKISDPTERSSGAALDSTVLTQLIERSTSDYEPKFGGFGTAPKFPRETLLQLLLQRARHTPDTSLNDMLRHTLTSMADGGIRDQLGGGFHRYSTDGRWLVPHFEIMLYDNALLASIYAQASLQLNEPRYAVIARGICDFVLREMTDPAGPFYTAFDAEVDGQEGLNYLWTEAETRELLGLDAAVFNETYGLDLGPNFADPHHGSGVPESNILFLPDGADNENDPHVVAARAKLLAARAQRKQPLLDTKILTSWNALMIRGLAETGEILGERRYVTAAHRAADWLLANHRASDGTIWRTSRGGGAAKYHGFLDDYAFLASGLLSLGRTDDAREIVRVMRERFLDDATGSFFFTDRNADELFARQKVITDSPLPSGNAIAAEVLLGLGDTEAVGRLLGTFSGSIRRDAGGMSAMIAVLDQYLSEGAAVQKTKVDGAASDPQPVTVTAHWLDNVDAAVTLTIADGFHLNARNVPAGLSQIEVIGAFGAEVNYPEGKVMKDIEIYEGTVQLTVRWPTPPKEAMRLRINYQPCTDYACLAVSHQIIELPVQS